MAVSHPRPNPEGDTRQNQVKERRKAAELLAEKYVGPLTQANSDENTLEGDGYAMSFTKGLHHGDNGILINNAHYSSLTEAINQDAPTDFTQLQRGISDNPVRQAKTEFSGDALDMEGSAPLWRGWESPRAGHYYSLEGPDADAVGMPPAPALNSVELEAEMAEVYALALLRDVSFSDLTSDTPTTTTSEIAVDDVVSALTGLEWYADKTAGDLSLQERRRRAARFASHAQHDIDNPPNDGQFQRKNLFRGSGPGVTAGPYLSQFMVQGTQMAKECDDGPDEYSHSSISYGSQEIDQKVSFFPEAVDYMLHWNAYLDVQNGADFGAANIRSHLPRKFIDTPRDLATYVRFDQLYQAYLNACLFMLGKSGNFKFQQPTNTDNDNGPGFPDRSSMDSRQGFATFGGPHVLSLVTEVATRCLKAVRRQKYNYHRRARPERLGALLTLDAGALSETVAQTSLQATTRDTLGTLRTRLSPMLELVNQHNQSRRLDTSSRDDRPPRKDAMDVTGRSHADPHLLNDDGQLDPANWDNDKNYLLPMAFAEGSPMHPSYGAGHATVAGGCVTILKAFFHTVDADGAAVLWPEELPLFEVQTGGRKVRDISNHVNDTDAEPVTISGELNKLAANISIGRDMAGVHFYTDYYESLRMGERVSTGILIEHMTQIDEPMEMTFHSFDGDRVHLYKTGGGTQVETLITNSQGLPVDFNVWWNRHLPEDSVSELLPRNRERRQDAAIPA
ncbi:MAG: hypothetical protein AB8B97_13115 [Granulosicoccus sp.]